MPSHPSLSGYTVLLHNWLSNAQQRFGMFLEIVSKTLKTFKNTSLAKQLYFLRVGLFGVTIRS